MDLLQHRRPRRASVMERRRFTEAFNACLEKDRLTPPGPKALAEEMGLGNKRNLNGRLSRLRRELLLANGFHKDDRDGRWYPRQRNG